MILGGLTLANQPTKNSGKRDGLFHGAPWRGRREGLQVKGQVVFDGRRRLHRLHLECGADICQGA